MVSCELLSEHSYNDFIEKLKDLNFYEYDEIAEIKSLHDLDNHCAVVLGESGRLIEMVNLDVLEEVSEMIDTFLLKFPQNEKALSWKIIVDKRLKVLGVDTLEFCMDLDEFESEKEFVTPDAVSRIENESPLVTIKGNKLIFRIK